MARVLVVEDDPQTAAELTAALGDYGLEVVAVNTGVAGLVHAVTEPFDAIVLDRMLPGNLDGLAVLTSLRHAGVEAPVLILSALSAVDERVRGLRAGGDDYLTKPFEFLELTARLGALMRRRTVPTVETSLRIADLEIDLLTRTVRRRGRTIELRPSEYRLLEYLMRHPDQVLTRTMLLEDVWGYRYDERSNLIDVHIAKLRKKLETEGDLPMIHTIHGAGYTLRAPD